MSGVTISSLVEGHGDVQAVRLLVQRIASETGRESDLRIERPIRVHADQLRRPGELERQIDGCLRRSGRSARILVLLDCDWKGCCPALAGPELLHRARSHAPDVVITVVLARYEFENWFIAAADSLRRAGYLNEDTPVIDAPESIRDAKKWLTHHMPETRSYHETINQASFASSIDLELARRSPSFDKFYREVVVLLDSKA